MLKFILPYPPSVNHYWGQFRNRRYIKKKGVEFRAEVISRIKDLPKFVGTVKIEIGVKFPDLRIRDLDNLLKPTLDAIQHSGIIDNDNLIRDIRIFDMGLDRSDASLEVRIVDIEDIKQLRFTI